MSFQSGNEEIGINPELILAQQEATGDSPWHQDDAPTETSQEAVAETLAYDVEPAGDPDELIAMLEATPQDFGRVIEGESQERLARPASDGDWGVVEILPYLGDWEEVVVVWVKRMIREDAPELKAVDDSLWAIEHGYANENPFESLERFARMRHDLVQVLQELDDEAWRRTAIHALHGRMTLHQLIDRMCDHDARYLAQARDALA